MTRCYLSLFVFFDTIEFGGGKTGSLLEVADFSISADQRGHFI